MQYEFTVDWFSHHIAWWNQILKHLKGKPNLRFLEIGSYEGRSAIWLLENILTEPSSFLVCIDTFACVELYRRYGVDATGIEERFCKNIAPYKSRVQVLKGESRNYLSGSFFANESFDFIYLDGSHRAEDVLQDALLAWNRLKTGGVLLFDDYTWREPDEAYWPARGINAFLAFFTGCYEVLHCEHQLAVRKLRNLGSLDSRSRYLE